MSVDEFFLHVRNMQRLKGEEAQESQHRARVDDVEDENKVREAREAYKEV